MNKKEPCWPRFFHNIYLNREKNREPQMGKLNTKSFFISCYRLRTKALNLLCSWEWSEGQVPLAGTRNPQAQMRHGCCCGSVQRCSWVHYTLPCSTGDTANFCTSIPQSRRAQTHCKWPKQAHSTALGSFPPSAQRRHPARCPTVRSGIKGGKDKGTKILFTSKLLLPLLDV